VSAESPLNISPNPLRSHIRSFGTIFSKTKPKKDLKIALRRFQLGLGLRLTNINVN
jgi:hypothetical protein